MVLCPRIERCLVYVTYLLVAVTAIVCCHQIRAVDKCWNWIYIPYILITANAISKLFQVETECPDDDFDAAACSSGGSKSGKRRGRAKSGKKCKSTSRYPEPAPNNCDSSCSKNSRRYDRSCGLPFSCFIDDITHFLSVLLNLPCFLTQFLLCNNVECCYAYMPLCLSAFPLMVYLIDNVKENSMLDILVIGNVIFLSAFSTQYNSNYGIAAAITFAVIHFILKPHKGEGLSKEFFYNFATSFFCILCLYTLNGKCFFATVEWFDLFSNPDCRRGC